MMPVSDGINVVGFPGRDAIWLECHQIAIFSAIAAIQSNWSDLRNGLVGGGGDLPKSHSTVTHALSPLAIQVLACPLDGVVCSDEFFKSAFKMASAIKPLFGVDVKAF